MTITHPILSIGIIVWQQHLHKTQMRHRQKTKMAWRLWWIQNTTSNNGIGTLNSPKAGEKLCMWLTTNLPGIFKGHSSLLHKLRDMCNISVQGYGLCFIHSITNRHHYIKMYYNQLLQLSLDSKVQMIAYADDMTIHGGPCELTYYTNKWPRC